MAQLVDASSHVAHVGEGRDVGEKPGLEPADLLLDHVAGLLPPVEAVDREAGGQRQVTDLEALHARIGVELEGAVGAAQESGSADEALGVGDGDVGGHHAAAAE